MLPASSRLVDWRRLKYFGDKALIDVAGRRVRLTNPP
jgi:hypothetical protein